MTYYANEKGQVGTEPSTYEQRLATGKIIFDVGYMSEVLASEKDRRWSQGVKV
jgi:hypothetical protein